MRKEYRLEDTSFHKVLIRAEHTNGLYILTGLIVDKGTEKETILSRDEFHDKEQANNYFKILKNYMS